MAKAVTSRAQDKEFGLFEVFEFFGFLCRYVAAFLFFNIFRKLSWRWIKNIGSSQIWVYEASGEGEEADIGEKEIKVTKAIRITLGNFNFVVEAF